MGYLRRRATGTRSKDSAASAFGVARALAPLTRSVTRFTLGDARFGWPLAPLVVGNEPRTAIVYYRKRVIVRERSAMPRVLEGWRHLV